MITVIQHRSRTLRLIRRVAILLTACIAVPAIAAQAPVNPSWQQEYWAKFDTKDWDAAITSAEQLVASARPASAETGLRLSEALTLLGSAQLSKGNYVAAEAAFAEALALAEQYGSPSSSALLDPLRGLGFTYAAEGKHAQAIPVLDRALLISRRSTGLFDVSQQGLLRQLATSLTAVGSLPEAERHMMYLRRLGERAYGVDDPRFIPILCIVGDWYMDAIQPEVARQHYRAAFALAERKLGKDSLAVVDPLRSIASSYMREISLAFYGVPVRPDRMSPLMEPQQPSNAEPINPRYINSEGERALNRALKVVASSTEASAALRAATLIQLGDWFIMKQSPAKAMPYFQEALPLLAQPGVTSEAGNPLSFPVQIYYPTPPLATRNLHRPPEETEDRFVQLEFTVQPDTTVTDVRVVDKDASERTVTQVAEAMRSARYRPRFVEGQPVATTAVGYRQVLKVRKEAKETGSDSG